MRKLYTSLLALALMLVSTAASAAIIAETLTANLDAVAANFEGYGVYHYWNFRNMSKDSGEAGTFTLSPTASDDGMVPLTTPNFENFRTTVGKGKVNEPDLRFRGDYGLYNFGSGVRMLRMLDLKAGMIVVIQGASNGSYLPTYGEVGVVDATAVEEITEEVHDAQLNREVGEGETAKADEYRYFRILKDGYFDFNVARACYVVTVAVLLDLSAAEAVSSPTLQVVGVNGDSRNIAFLPGSSTNEESEVYTFFTYGDNSDPENPVPDPIVMADSEEIDYYVVLDEEGNVLRKYTVAQKDEEGAIPAEDIEQLIPVYKKVFSLSESFEDGVPSPTTIMTDATYFDPEDLYAQIFAADGDADGNVTIKYVSVSSTGVASAIVTQVLKIEELQLNAPTLTLVGFDDELRIYQVGWENNTRSGETFTINWTADDDERGAEDIAIGDLIKFANHAIVTVQVEGYQDGVYEQDAFEPGVKYYRKNSSAEHDWDFTNLKQEQKDLIMGTVIDHYYTTDDEGNVTATYTIEEAADLPEEMVLQVAYKPSGWSWDGVRSRAMRIPVVTNTIYTDETNTAVDHYEFDGYENDLADLFTNGLSISGAEPYTGSTKFIGSSQYIYINPDPTGYLYLSGTAQLNFDEETVKYGEYVVVTYTAGVPACVCANNRVAGYSYTVKNANIRYIDIYTCENLPEPPEEVVGIEDVKANTVKKTAAIYNLAGQRVDSNYKGIVIKDGKKVLVK